MKYAVDSVPIVKIVNRLISITIFLALCFSNSIKAKNIRFANIDVDDGLPYNSVRAVVQDEFGYLWFGTEQGLAKYDGYSLVTYLADNNDPNSIADPYVFALEVDDKGILWVGSDKGLSRFNRDTDDFTLFSHQETNPDSLISNTVNAILRDKNGNLWIGTDEGVDRLNTTNMIFEHISCLPCNKSKNKVRALVRSKLSEHIYIGGNNGFMSLANNTIELVELDKSTQPIVLSLAEDSSGNIWVGTTAGLYEYNPISESVRKIQLEKEVKLILSLITDEAGNIWVGTYKHGIFRIDKNDEMINIGPDRSNATALSDRSILSLHQDRSGIMWVGTYRSGVDFFNPDSLRFGAKDNTEQSLSCLPSADVRSAFALSNSNVLIGTLSGLVNLDLIRQTCTLYESHKNDISTLSSNGIYAIFEDSSGDQWIGTNNGIDRLNPKTGMFIRFGEHVDNASVSIILEQNNHIVFKASNGIFKLNLTSNIISEISSLNAFLDDVTVHAMVVDRRRNIWIASDRGVLVIDSQLQHFDYKEYSDKSFVDKSTNALVIDKAGVIWITIEGEGLFIFQPESGELIPIGAKLGLNIKSAFSGLQIDELDNIWLTTLNQGLFKINASRKDISNFHVSDGLHSELFNFDSFAKFPDGRLLFGGKSGFNLFDPTEIKTNQYPPIVSLSKLNRFGKEVIPHQGYNGFKIIKHISELTELHLSHSDNVFGFDFIATHYLDSKKIKYAHKLDGFDADWTTTNAQNRGVTYNNIDPGEYVFRLKAQTKNGVWSENDVALKIIVSPAPWLTWWAYTIYAVSLLLAIFFFIRKRTQILQARATHLQQTVDQRTGELVNEKSKVEQLLSRKNEEFANVSHEFRTPLTLILGPLAQIIKNNHSQQETDRLNIIQRNGYRLLRMVDQLLNLETFRVKSISQRTSQATGKIIKMLTEAFADLAREKDITLTCKSIENINFEFTPDALEKIVVNLLSNAIKYTGEGGEITVSSIRTAENELEIKVQDNGIGIPVENQASIFERYHRVLDENSEQVTGAGIGLALVNELVQSHQGRIEVISELGRGTTFMVYLPIIKEVDDSQVTSHSNDEIIAMELMGLASHSESRPQAEHSFYHRDNNRLPTVLVIEDNQDMRNYIATSINNDYQVITANDGEEGVKDAIKEVPDLIISDVMMPIKDGYQVTHELRSNIVTNHIPIILLTARGDRESRLKGWYEKADEYLTKPFDVEELAIRISNLLSIRDILRQRFNQSLSMLNNETDETPKNSEVSAEEVKQREFLSKLAKVVSEHYVNPDIKVAEIAGKVAMSERQLFRKLKGILDVTPTQYLNNYRLVHAAKRLTKGEPSSNVAYDVGFASHTYFGKCFKAKYGTTPSKYCS